MSDKPFRFKQFVVHQDRCAMKIGTDGVLLGAWTSLNKNPFSILDIGTGTGVLSLMMAQRSSAELIDAIEIDDEAYEQCVGNFEASPWNDRLFCYHAGFDEFVEEIDDRYDLIIANPPFYGEDINSGNAKRDMARGNASLPFHNLLEGVSRLLGPHGSFSVVLPYKEEGHFIELAKMQNLHPFRITRVKGNPTSEIKRSLIEFSFQKTVPQISILTIEKSRHEYTEAYKALTRDFYVKM